MGKIKDFLGSLGEKGKERKQQLKQLEQESRFQRIVEERQKSSNERELNRYLNEDREKDIKEMLEIKRKQREKEISLNHNPINAKMVVGRTQWEILKDKNKLLNSKQIFANEKNIFKHGN